MKKFILLLSIALLNVCAMGINHNVASVNGQTYLIESKQRNLFLITQWTQESNISVLEEDDFIRRSSISYFNDILSECKKEFDQRTPLLIKYIIV